MNLRFSLRLLLLVLTASALQAQYLSRSAYVSPPKREMRGAWIATVVNIDWTTSNSQANLTATLDSLVNVGVNSIFFQVRPSCDAFYASAIEPWSQWISGAAQGTNPGYDPLQFVIDACRQRGLEIHAWFNPYRAVVNTSSSSVAPTHVSVTHPEWVLTFGTLKILNPGIPSVREYVTGVIMDVARRYDLDGIHFDDYFYSSSITTEDLNEYNLYGGGMSLGDWRRENVNILVRTIRDSLAAFNSRLKFGISPPGVWRNSPYGPTVGAYAAYDAIYADSRRWLQEGWIDYLVPQIYWPFSHSVAPYGILTNWWNDNAFSRHIYIGQATYRAIDPAAAGWSVQELADQIDFNRTKANILGSVHFSAKYFKSNSRLVNDSLRGSVYPKVTSEIIRRPFALRPTMPWRDSVPPVMPDSFRIEPSAGKTYAFIRWKAPTPASDGEVPARYLVYSSTSLPIDFNELSNVVYVTTGTSYTKFPATGDPNVYYFAVTSLDRHDNESVPTQTFGWSYGGTVVGVEEATASPTTIVLNQNYPNPFNPTTVVTYQLSVVGGVDLRVYDVLGREVAVLVDAVQQPGRYQVTFNGEGLASGLYFYRLVANGLVETKKMQLLK